MNSSTAFASAVLLTLRLPKTVRMANRRESGQFRAAWILYGEVLPVLTPYLVRSCAARDKKRHSLLPSLHAIPAIDKLTKSTTSLLTNAVVMQLYNYVATKNVELASYRNMFSELRQWCNGQRQQR